MTTTTGPTRALIEQLSAEHPEFRYEISTRGLVEMDMTPPTGAHGAVVIDLAAWLVNRYGRGRAATEAGIATSRTDPEPYRQVDLALFRERVPGSVRYHDPADIALVVEVLSRSTADIDRGEKFHEFEAVGITQYWLVDPDERMVVMWRLTAAGYRQERRIGVDELLDSAPQDHLAL